MVHEEGGQILTADEVGQPGIGDFGGPVQIEYFQRLAVQEVGQPRVEPHWVAGSSPLRKLVLHLKWGVDKLPASAAGLDRREVTTRR